MCAHTDDEHIRSPPWVECLSLTLRPWTDQAKPNWFPFFFRSVPLLAVARVFLSWSGEWILLHSLGWSLPSTLCVWVCWSCQWRKIGTRRILMTWALMWGVKAHHWKYVPVACSPSGAVYWKRPTLETEKNTYRSKVCHFLQIWIFLVHRWWSSVYWSLQILLDLQTITSYETLVLDYYE